MSNAIKIFNIFIFKLKYIYICFFSLNYKTKNMLDFGENNTDDIIGKIEFKDVSFTVHRNDKIAFLSSNTLNITMLFDILAGKETPDSGEVKWGKTITTSYLMNNSDEYFDGCQLTLIDWLRRFSKDQTETFLRGWLGYTHKCVSRHPFCFKKRFTGMRGKENESMEKA